MRGTVRAGELTDRFDNRGDFLVVNPNRRFEFGEFSRQCRALRERSPEFNERSYNLDAHRDRLGAVQNIRRLNSAVLSKRAGTIFSMTSPS